MLATLARGAEAWLSTAARETHATRMVRAALAGRLQLRAERRWGQLLGPAEHGGAREQVTDGHLKSAEIKAWQRARQVAGPCDWRDCDAQATRELRYGRVKQNKLPLVAVYCDPHGDEVQALFFVESDVELTSSLAA